MPPSKTRLVASQDQPASEQYLFPDLFVEAINHHWLVGDRVVMRVLPDVPHQTQDNWLELGKHLTAELLLNGTYVGICFDGDPAFDTRVLRWLGMIRETVQHRGIADGVVELK